MKSKNVIALRPSQSLLFLPVHAEDLQRIQAAAEATGHSLEGFAQLALHLAARSVIRSGSTDLASCMIG
ncbi:hypothetical protein ACPCHQ_21990 [Ralstonia thomasii]|uniref:hypothetical protein n=1 Tax=Ralstonia thomasii TaxID=3058596 RepID=UPI003C2B63B1